MRIFHLIACLGVLLGLAQSAFAFNAEGHQTVAALAEQLIKGKPAEAGVKALLGKTSLATVAVWADCVKGVKLTGTGSSAPAPGAEPFPECKPFQTKAGIKMMEDFVRANHRDCDWKPGEEDCHKTFHYTDIAIQRDHYAPDLVGASKHDVVAAINAMVTVLKGGKAPALFHLPGGIAGRKQALMLLVHYVGDIHQPLHVASVYLDKSGHVIDPDATTFDPATSTHGGNATLVNGKTLHSIWDGVSPNLSQRLIQGERLPEDGSVAASTGDIMTWSGAWAGDTLRSGKSAFDNLKFSENDPGHHWQVSLPDAYRARVLALQRKQLIKGGERLAQILQAIWP